VIYLIFQQLVDDINRDHIFSYSLRPETKSIPDNIIFKIITKLKVSDPVETLINVINSRGFFVIRYGKYFGMSDNCYFPYDFIFLDRLLKNLGFENVLTDGIINENNLNIFENKINQLKIFFEFTQSSAFRTDYGEGNIPLWGYFKRRRHGWKVPVERLDPFISYLVKAISAAGISTMFSCDGHGIKNPYVAFATKYDAALFSVFFDVYVAELAKKNNWNLDYNLYFVSDQRCLFSIDTSDKRNRVVNYYYILKIADVFYQNRIMMRDQKRVILKGVHERDVIDLGIEDVYNLFIKKINQS
jgi:hypothetical protein